MINKIGFSGQLYVNGKAYDTHQALRFIQKNAPDAEDSYRKLLPVLSNSTQNLIFSSDATNEQPNSLGIRYCVGVAPDDQINKPFVIDETETHNQNNGFGELLKPSYRFKWSNLFKCQSPWIKREAPIWTTLTAILQQD